jgi:hypothetical protein
MKKDDLRGAFLTMEKFDNREYNSVGSSRIRARWLMPYWPECEEFCIGKNYDFHIYQKVYWKAMMEAFKGIKIIDLCDPDWLENKPVFEFIDLADAVTTSTQSLADYIQKMRPHMLVKCIPDRILMSEVILIKEDYGTELKSLVWFGYSHNTHYLFSAFDEFIRRDIELTVISNNPFELPLAYKGRLKVQNVPYNYETINKELIKADAVFLPDPTGDEKARYKSNNKTLQAWSLGMPVISAPKDLDTFMWMEARKEEGKKRRKEIEDKWDIKFSVDEYKELIKKIKEKKNG